jgi:YggT family protein
LFDGDYEPIGTSATSQYDVTPDGEPSSCCGGRVPFLGSCRLWADERTMLIARLIDLYSFVVLVDVVLSWVPVDPGQPLVRWVRSLTEPALRPIRQVLPPMGGLDLSPIVLLIALQLLRGVFY